MLKFLFLISLFMSFLIANQNYKLLIPLYSHPSQWKSFETQFKLLKDKNIQTYMIINPNNGPGQKVDQSYIDGIKYLKSFDFKIIGYVHTQYSKRNLFDVKLDIYNWSDFYGSNRIDGIFFDETDTKKSSFNYYKSLTNYSKVQDFNFNILNAGYTTDKIYIDNKIANIIITFENSYEGFLKDFPKNTNKSNDFTKLSILVHSVKNKKFYDLLLKTQYLNFDFIYFTEDTFPNPWDELSLEFIKTLHKNSN